MVKSTENEMHTARSLQSKQYRHDNLKEPLTLKSIAHSICITSFGIFPIFNEQILKSYTYYIIFGKFPLTKIFIQKICKFCGCLRFNYPRMYMTLRRGECSLSIYTSRSLKKYIRVLEDRRYLFP